MSVILIHTGRCRCKNTREHGARRDLLVCTKSVEHDPTLAQGWLGQASPFCPGSKVLCEKSTGNAGGNHRAFCSCIAKLLILYGEDESGCSGVQCRPVCMPRPGWPGAQTAIGQAGLRPGACVRWTGEYSGIRGIWRWCVGQLLCPAPAANRRSCYRTAVCVHLRRPPAF